MQFECFASNSNGKWRQKQVRENSSKRDGTTLFVIGWDAKAMQCDAMIRKRKQYLCWCAKNTSNENRHRTNIFIRCATTFMNAIRLHFDGAIEIGHSLNALARKRKRDREIWMENYLPNCKHRWHTMTYSRDRAKSIRIFRTQRIRAHTTCNVQRYYRADWFPEWDAFVRCITITINAKDSL